MRKYIIISLMTVGVTTSFVLVNTTKEQKTSKEKISTLKWFTDFEKANAESVKTGKPIFGFFTGSDWCGWCKRLQSTVFSKADFKKFAKKEVILLELDFPRRKKIPANIKAQNQQLARVFNVRAYPTVWIFKTTKDKKTKQVSIDAWGSCGYPQGAVAGKEEVKFISDVKKIFANKKKAVKKK